MTAQDGALQEKLAAALRWEKTKRREAILLAALGLALAGSLLLLPAKDFLPSGPSLHAVPLALFFLLALGMHFLRPWTKRDSLMTMVRWDKALQLHERVLTAWEILEIGERSAAQLHVMKEAEWRLQRVEPRALFKRRLSWPAYGTPLLLLLWFVGVWSDFGLPDLASRTELSSPLAQQLKDFARALEKKAKTEGLAESLKMARALDEIAEKMGDGRVAESEARERLKALDHEIDEKIAARRSALEGAAVERLAGWRRTIEELEAARLQGAGAEDAVVQKLFQGLASLPWPGPESQNQLSQSGRPSAEELHALAAKLSLEIQAELDRRSLEEMRAFLAFMTPGGETQMAREPRGEDAAQGSGKAHESEDGDRADGRVGSLPGDRPGEKAFSSPPPSFQARAATHLRGLLGQGKASGLALRGKPGAKQSRVVEDAVADAYERQAEEALASEEIPDRLKEVVKSYFLSLGMGEKK